MVVSTVEHLGTLNRQNMVGAAFHGVIARGLHSNHFLPRRAAVQMFLAKSLTTIRISSKLLRLGQIVGLVLHFSA